MFRKDFAHGFYKTERSETNRQSSEAFTMQQENGFGVRLTASVFGKSSPRECATEGGTYNYFCFAGKEFPIKKYNSSKQNKTVQCTITRTVGAIKLLQTSSSLYGSHQGHAVCILQVTSHGKTVGKSCNLYPQRL